MRFQPLLLPLSGGQLRQNCLPLTFVCIISLTPLCEMAGVLTLVYFTSKWTISVRPI